MSAPVDCPIGQYCPAQTSTISNEAIDCPAGTYNDRLNIGSEEECTPCPVGKYCPSSAIPITSADDAVDCEETFFCPYGSAAGSGYSDEYEFGKSASGLCPAGYTCAAGAIAPTPCPLGQYNPTAGATACLPCEPGYYCDEQGMSASDADN